MAKEKGDTREIRVQAEVLPAVDPKLLSLGSDVSIRRERSLSPLAPLFPPLGDARALRGLAGKLEARLEGLSETVSDFGEKSFEETMLRQVLEWLAQTEEEL